MPGSGGSVLPTRKRPFSCRPCAFRTGLDLQARTVRHDPARALGLGTGLAPAFSVCDVSEQGLRIIFQTVGRGTRKLAELVPGQKVTVWGPLGRWFRIDEARPNLILAGGVGIAPFVMLARREKTDNLSMLFGHRLDLEHYPYAEIAARIKSEAMQQKTVADIAEFEIVLSERIKALAGVGQVLACGPEPMLKVVRRYCLLHGTDGQVSLENRMACGVGACLGCVGKTVAGDYVQSCVHGPVFDVREIDLGD